MSLWQAYKFRPNPHVITQAYIDLTNNAAFTDLGLVDFTAEAWVWIPNYVSADVSKGFVFQKSYPGSPTYSWNIAYQVYYGNIIGFSVYSICKVVHPQLHEVMWQSVYDVGMGSYTTPHLLAGEWNHIASTFHPNWDGPDHYFWGNGTLRIPNSQGGAYYYINGETDADRPLTVGLHLNSFLADEYSKLKVGWMRISSGIRYTTAFTPDSRLSPPASDGTTLGLWYCNTGTGTVAENIQGDPDRGGTIHEPHWDGNVLELNI